MTSNGALPSANGFVNPQFSSIESQKTLDSKSIEKNETGNQSKPEVGLRKVPEPPKPEEVPEEPDHMTGSNTVAIDKGLG